MRNATKGIGKISFFLAQTCYIVFVVYNKTKRLSNHIFARSIQKNKKILGSVFIFSISFSFMVFLMNIAIFHNFYKKILAIFPQYGILNTVP